MKMRWALAAGLLLLILVVCVGFLFYVLGQGSGYSIPVILLIWGIAVCAGGVVACVVWAVGWLPRKKKS